MAQEWTAAIQRRELRLSLGKTSLGCRPYTHPTQAGAAAGPDTGKASEELTGRCRSDLRQAFSCLREPGKYWISKDISNRWAMGKMQRQRREAEMQDSVLVYSAVYWPMKNTPISWRPLGKCTETLLLRYDPTKLNPGPKHTHRSHKREERKGGGLYEVGMRGWGSAVCSRMK